VERAAVIAIAPKEHDPKPAADQAARSPHDDSQVTSRWKWLLAATAVCIIIIIAGRLCLHSRSRPKLTERDAVVLGDFENKTGDPVFDETLKQELSVQLAQSPFLDLISDQETSQILQEMGHHAGDRLTPEIAREVCLRTNCKTMLTGSIVPLGSQYVVGLRATDCNTGHLLAEAQEQAAKKEAVLRALDTASVSLRSQLGESLNSVAKYAPPG